MINFYNNGTTYICVVQRGNEWKICVEDSFIDSNNIVTIHKKHESILNAVLSDNSVEILATLSPKTVSTIKGCDFISTYNESWDYLLVEKETLSIKDGDKLYEFVKPDFECELLAVRDNYIYGLVKDYRNNTSFLYPFTWTSGGTCYDTDDQIVEKYNLTPIVKEKPWYEDESNFPALISFEINDKLLYQVAYDIEVAECPNLIMLLDFNNQHIINTSFANFIEKVK